MASLLYGSTHDSLLLAFSNSALVRMPCNTWSKDVAIHQSGSINVISNVLSVRMPCHILSRHTTFHQCGLRHVFAKKS